MNRAPRLYLVTDRRRTAGRDLVETVERALRGGVDAVQLREKDLDGRKLFELGTRLLAACRRTGAQLLVNDRIDVARAIGAHGVHLPGNSFQVTEARRLLGPHGIVGVSTHSAEEARIASSAGADFVLFGPVYDTASKRVFGAPQGLTALREVVREAGCPVLAIGGVTPERLPELQDLGIAGVAAIGALLEAQEPTAVAAALRIEFRG